MLELLALLLPVAAASGWLAAKRHYTRKYLLDHARPINQAYCRGLNYLLSEKTDQAIKVFAHILEMDHETVETHIALGNLFRKQGEVEKAIEVHTRLLEEPGLGEAQRAHARYALGVDYMAAGLLDRAESIFEALAEREAHRKSSLQRLLQIYQQEKEWPKAIACVRKLLRFAKAPKGESVAQFLCELAEESVARFDGKAARDYLDQALRDDPACVRASLVKARLQLAAADYAGALRTLRNVEAQNPDYLPEALHPVAVCYARLGDERGWADYLEYLYRRYGLAAAAFELAAWMRDAAGIPAALDYSLAALEAKPSLRGLGHTVRLLSVSGGGPEPRLELGRLGAVVDRLAAEIPRYRCVECGFGGSELHWRCPSCQHWASIKPA